MQYCANIPNASHLLLANATVPVSCLPVVGESEYTRTIDSLTLIDIHMVDGIVTQIAAANNSQRPDSPQWALVDLRRGMVLPTFVDLHTHIGIEGQLLVTFSLAHCFSAPCGPPRAVTLPSQIKRRLANAAETQMAP